MLASKNAPKTNYKATFHRHYGGKQFEASVFISYTQNNTSYGGYHAWIRGPWGRKQFNKSELRIEYGYSPPSTLGAIEALYLGLKQFLEKLPEEINIDYHA